jgi:hypothetical protein
MPVNLQTGLLLRIMEYLGEHRDVYPNWVTTPDLLPLVEELVGSEGAEKALCYLDRHSVFLMQLGYLQTGTATLGARRALRLTAQGEMFVQPDLAEFGKEPLLPQVVKSIEGQILSYPEDKRDGFLFELRDAIARNRADFIAKLLVEGLPALIRSQQ